MLGRIQGRGRASMPAEARDEEIDQIRDFLNGEDDGEEVGN